MPNTNGHFGIDENLAQVTCNDESCYLRSHLIYFGKHDQYFLTIAVIVSLRGMNESDREGRREKCVSWATLCGRVVFSVGGVVVTFLKERRKFR